MNLYGKTETSSGGGKTTFFLYPNLEYSCATGMSFLVTDTKGDVFRDYATIAEKYYGYKTHIIDLRRPMNSGAYNMVHLVNKYYDLYRTTGYTSYQAKSERYAKITAKTIVRLKGFDGGGQNAFFYDAAEGLIASVILIVAEFCAPEERHIVSVFKIVQELMKPDPAYPVKKEEFPITYLQTLMNLLPADHKAKWLCIAQDSILVCRRDAEIQKDCYETTKAVNVFAGRVALPSFWLQRNGLQKEDFVFQLLTTNGVLIFPHQQQIKL